MQSTIKDHSEFKGKKIIKRKMSNNENAAIKRKPQKL